MTQQPFRPAPARRQKAAFQRGQSIVVALLVLLLLGLTGALFVTIIARNLINANHANRVQTSDYYAAAGITYADAQLSSSLDGADWRPPLQAALLNPPAAATREGMRYSANAPAAANASDPDLEYLQAGYARYNTGAGRFLLRVTYDPVNVSGLAVPPGKYLKIESIGREGVIDPIDPTTYSNNRSTARTQAYKVAYKPIGITDYARFETNPDKRSDIANLGVASQLYTPNADGGIATPGVSDFNTLAMTSANGTTPPTIQEYPVLTTYGAPDAYTGSGASLEPNPNAGTATATASGFTAGGGSIHANMPVRFFGNNIIYLNSATNAPLFQDTAEIAGDLLLDSYDQKAKLDNSTLDTSGTNPVGQQAALILNPTDLTKLTTTGTYITPSNDTQSTGDLNKPFDTQGGLIRDGSMQNDPEGLPRSVTRLEPPLMDAQDSASQLPRYRAIAMNSAPRTYTSASGTTMTYAAAASQYGYGKSIYINNPNDVQPDSATIGGGSTLTDEWLHGNSFSASGVAKGGWNGFFYNPPGVSIVLGQQITPPANATTAGVYGIRLSSSTGTQFPNPDGTPNGPTELDVAYSDLGAEATNTNLNAGTSPDNDIIIYAEGNVRVRGIASPDEGTPTSQMATPRKATTIPRHITIVTDGTAYIEGNLLKGDPDSSISVLAHDYVCINTTQFLAGSNIEDRTGAYQNPTLPDTGNYLILNDNQSLLQEFNFGLPNGATASGMPYLYVSAGPEAPTSTAADFSITDTTTNVTTQLTPDTFSAFRRTTYSLSSVTSLAGALATDVFNLSIQKDTGSSGLLTPENVALERDAILPMDIRIEAVLYAQTRSFFVIPGEWFNTDTSDNIATYLNSYANFTMAASRPTGTDDRFPLYGQPIDLKITIDGTVSEARPADIAAQTAWMQKWGWIPQYHGSMVTSSGSESAGHTLAGQPAIGLQIIYDPETGYPYHPGAGTMANPSYYLRSDAYGRPLPFTPKLPVSTGLLYSGESGEAPLLQ